MRRPRWDRLNVSRETAPVTVPQHRKLLVEATMFGPEQRQIVAERPSSAQQTNIRFCTPKS
jgi:hypothetical protein